MYRYLFFDLDGTLTDSSEGIFNCLRYALEKMGTPPLPHEVERLFIGPPLQDSFTAHCGYTRQQVLQAIQYFRERYLRLGIHEVAPVPGMQEALEELKRRGFVLTVTSSKENTACRTVVDNLGLTPYFTVVMGSTSDLSSCTKADVIRFTMQALGLTADDAPSILMVGDRKYDVLGARECGIACLGLDCCGFAPAGELEEAGAIAIVHTPEEMVAYILHH